jgi:hypothetical protein
VRKTLAVTAAASAALALAGLAAAGRPEKDATPLEPFAIPAGAVCSFGLDFSYPAANNGFEITHTQANGKSWIWGGGNNVTRVADDSTGAYLDVNTTGPGKIIPNPDGSYLIDGTGHWMIAYGPGDSPSSSLLLYSGHIVLTQGADGSLSLVSYVGAPVQNLCAALAGAND